MQNLTFREFLGILDQLEVDGLDIYGCIADDENPAEDFEASVTQHEKMIVMK